MLNRLLPLEPGSIIDVICPASKEGPNFRNALDKACKKHGFVARVLNENDPTEPFSAANDETRWKFMKQALDNPDSKVIYAKGGYGTIRLFKYLQDYKPKYEKILIGFSDVTSLHIWFSHKYGWQTIHGHLAREGDTRENQESADEVFEYLKNLKPIIYADFTPLNELAKQTQEITAVLAGGNLCLIETSIGTNWQADFSNKIVFLEDTNEAGYSIDRSLEHLCQAGLFKDCRAVFFGDFDNQDKDEQILINIALDRFANSVQVPVFQAIGFGHSVYNFPLVFNRKVKLISTDTTATLQTL